MKPRSLNEFLEIYDYCNRHCKSDPLIGNRKTFRSFIEQAALYRAMYLRRNGSKIESVAFAWPIDDLPKEEEFPPYSMEGKILWCQYCFITEKHRQENVMAKLLAEAMRDLPKTEVLAYRRTKKGGRIYVRRFRRAIEKAEVKDSGRSTAT